MTLTIKPFKQHITPPFPNNHEFEHIHRKKEAQLKNYLTTKRGRLPENQNLVRELLESSALSHYATNFTARIGFTKAATKIIKNKWKREKENKTQQEYGFMTLTPRFSALPLSEAGLYDWSALQQWATQHLNGLNYIGIVEAAFFSNIAINGTKEPTVSWHLHIIIWGAERTKIKKIIQKINSTEEALIEDKRAAHYRPIKGLKDLACTTRYIFKNILNDYRVWAKKQPKKDGKKDWDQAKSDIKSGNAIKIYRLFNGITIDALCFHGGDGEKLIKRISTRSVRKIKIAEEKRQQLICEAVNGVSL